MLVLSRKAGESVMVGDEVKITITTISGKQVRIGIDAPKDITIHRKEIYDKVKEALNDSDKIEPIDS